MHMTDALLSPAVGLAMNAVSAATIGISAAKIKKHDLGDKTAPIMGVAGALVFAGQMINFTIPATGSSGHIGGGILLAGLVGGVPAFLSMCAVLIIQCLFFADGGLLALGGNIFVLGAIPCLFVYPLVFKPLMRGKAGYGRLSIASVTAVTIGLELGAFGIVLLTFFSGITSLPFAAFLSLMLPIHFVIGIIEGIITAAILSFIYKMRPEIIDYAQTNRSLNGVSIKKTVAILAAAAIVTGGLLSLFISANPDGLEWSVAKTTEQASGAAEALEAEGAVYRDAAGVQDKTAFLPDYGFASEPGAPAGTSVSGIIGSAITFVLAAAAGIIITGIKNKKDTETVV
jgi:cobalt/nickel transport system permease protein